MTESLFEKSSSFEKLFTDQEFFSGMFMEIGLPCQLLKLKITFFQHGSFLPIADLCKLWNFLACIYDQIQRNEVIFRIWTNSIGNADSD